MQRIPGLKRAYLLAVLAVVLTILSARFAFWNTWQAWQLNRQLDSRMIEASNVSFQPAYLERKHKNLSNAVKLYQVDTSAYRNIVLTAISTLAEQEKVRIIDVPTKDNNSYHQATTYQVEKIELQGEYMSLIKFYHKLSAVSGIGVIRSAQLTSLTQQGRVTSEGKLRLLLYLEIIK